MKVKFSSLPKSARFAIVGASVFILICCLCFLATAIIPSDNSPTNLSTNVASPSSEIIIPMLPSVTVETLPSSPTSAPNTITTLIVPSGDLAQYLDTYSSYEEVFVTKIDGSLDVRPNDLEELFLDWLYYRDKILEYTQAGKNDKASEARTAWNEINDWLDEYHENDVGTMFTIIEKRNK